MTRTRERRRPAIERVILYTPSARNEEGKPAGNAEAYEGESNHQPARQIMPWKQAPNDIEPEKVSRPDQEST